jgi:hypothetical protein
MGFRHVVQPAVLAFRLLNLAPPGGGAFRAGHRYGREVSVTSI